jgi:antitoxin PrlF
VVSRASGGHEDPAIRAFLGVLARDIRHGKRVQQLPKSLIQAMHVHSGSGVDPDEEIEGDVAL